MDQDNPDDQEYDDLPEATVPRLFALCVALDDEPDEANVADTVFHPNYAVAWGMAFADHAVTYDREPEAFCRDTGNFPSARRALKTFTRVYREKLQLVWFPEQPYPR